MTRPSSLRGMRHLLLLRAADLRWGILQPCPQDKAGASNALGLAYAAPTRLRFRHLLSELLALRGRTRAHPLTWALAALGGRAFRAASA